MDACDEKYVACFAGKSVVVVYGIFRQYSQKVLREILPISRLFSHIHM